MTDKQTPPPDLDAERELDLGRIWRTLLKRWWLPVGGLVLGLAVGYLLSLGQAHSFKAEALVSLGTPFTDAGSPLAGLTSNPRQVQEIVNSESALRSAAGKAGLRSGDLRGTVAVRTVSAGLPAKAQGPQLLGISVSGARPLRVALAADRLAEIATNRTAAFVDKQVTTYRQQLANQGNQLASLATRITALQQQVDDKNLSPLDRLVLVSYLDNAEQRRGALLDSQASTQQKVALAEEVERPKILQHAAAVETTGRSRHNSMAVAGLVGLILGIVAALLWDWGAARSTRPPATA